MSAMDEVRFAIHNPGEKFIETRHKQRVLRTKEQATRLTRNWEVRRGRPVHAKKNTDKQCKWECDREKPLQDTGNSCPGVSGSRKCR